MKPMTMIAMANTVLGRDIKRSVFLGVVGREGWLVQWHAANFNKWIIIAVYVTGPLQPSGQRSPKMNSM
jgi:hypothetical protein